MTNIEKRILENQEVIMLAIGDMIEIQQIYQDYSPYDIQSKLIACYDETREVLGKELIHPNQYHFTEI